MRKLERKVRKRAALRLQPSVITNNRVRRYFPLCGSRTIGTLAVIYLRLFSRRGNNHGAWLQGLMFTQLTDEALDGLVPRKPLSDTRSCQMATALRPRLRPSSMASRNGSHSLTDEVGLETLDSTPNPVVASLAVLGDPLRLPILPRSQAMTSRRATTN